MDGMGAREARPTRRAASRRARVALSCLLAVGVALAGSVAWAAKQQYTISNQKTGKRLLAAQEALQNEQFEEAMTVLDGFKMDKLNPYEAALVYQMRAYGYANQEQFEDAAEAFRMCLEQNALPPETQHNLRFNLAQIYMMLERWDEAVENLEIWFADTETPTPSAFYTLASAYYQADREDDAVAPAEQAVFRSEQPQERWLQLLFALYLDRGRYEEGLPLIEEMVSRFPKKNYWIQLAAVYAELGKDEKSLAVQQLTYAQGLLANDRELRRLAQMYIFHELPYRAALVLEKGIEAGQVEKDKDAWQILGNSWLAAREFEKALGPLQEAAALGEDGELWLRLAQVHVSREEWDEALDAADKAMAKGLDQGGPNTLGHAYMLSGIAHFNRDRFVSAKTNFARAKGYEKTRKMAESWTTYVERTEARLQ